MLCEAKYLFIVKSIRNAGIHCEEKNAEILVLKLALPASNKHGF
jgi:hypothetical protein